jgi:hypothetical protein
MDLENFPTNEVAKDMLTMVSPIYDESYVGKWIFEVMSVYLGLAKDTIRSLEYESFVERATWTLMYHEIMYGLDVREDLTYEERRKIIRRKIAREMRSTPYYIEHAIADEFDQIIHVYDVNDEGKTFPHNSIFEVEFSGADKNYYEVLERINEMKQSQTTYEVSIVYPEETVSIGVACVVKEVKKRSSSYTVETVDDIDWYTDENGDVLLDEGGHMLFAE